MLFRDGGRRRGSWPGRWAATPSRRSTPSSCRPSSTAGVDLRTAVAAPRWFVEPAAHFEPPVEVRLEPRHATGIPEALEALGHPVTEAAPFDRGLGHEHAIELVDGGPARRRLAGGRDRPAQRRSAGGLVTAGAGGGRLCDTRAAGGGLRSHDAATGPSSGQRAAERAVTSNVGQNYPYTSETEAERAAAIATPRSPRATAWPARSRPRRRRSTPNERWWVWKCPTPGCPGLLHVAGYAREQARASYVVCDGTCGKTFLR